MREIMTFTVYQDRSKEWRWRAKRNGRITADSGEGYTRRYDCERAVRRFVKSIHKKAVLFTENGREFFFARP